MMDFIIIFFQNPGAGVVSLPLKAVKDLFDDIIRDITVALYQELHRFSLLQKAKKEKKT
jgi:hypothetical protein